MRHIYLLITLLLGLLAGSVTYAEQPRVEPAELSREYQIKAAMLYKIAWFVRWKTQSFADTDSSINLCLSEPEPFGLFLDQVIDGRLFGKNKRPLSIIRLDEDNYHNKLVDCHLLFVPKESLLPVPSRSGLLVVSEGQPIATGNTHINFVTNGEHVVFEINRKKLKESRIRVSSKLLKLAHVVRD